MQFKRFDLSAIEAALICDALIDFKHKLAEGEQGETRIKNQKTIQALIEQFKNDLRKRDW
jgi:hypothetical protein